MDKKQKLLIMKQLATMSHIVTAHGDIQLDGNIDLQVDIGQAIDKYIKKQVREGAQVDMFQKHSETFKKQVDTMPKP